MGTRINYLVKASKSDECICASLYSNSSHNEVDAEQIFRELAEGSIGPNGFVPSLLDCKYPSNNGTNKEGDSVFTFDSTCGDKEKIILVHWDYEVIGMNPQPIFSEVSTITSTWSQD